MSDFSEENLKVNCPHCDPHSFALKYPLDVTSNFWVVCDVHPLIEGHILIIPKKHFSCIAEYPQSEFSEFLSLFAKFSNFVKKIYGSISTFEHGKIGQTVFHSHVHLLPFNGKPETIVPEGIENLTQFKEFIELRHYFEQEGKYLYFSLSNKMWIVNTSLGAPRFFRDRFANALGVPNKGNWKEMDLDKKSMERAVLEIKNLQIKWSTYNQ